MATNSGTIVSLSGVPVTLQADRSGFDLKIEGLSELAAREHALLVRYVLSTHEWVGKTVRVSPTVYGKGWTLGLAMVVELLGLGKDDTFFFGHVHSAGEVCPVSGILPLVRMAKEQGAKAVMIAADNAAEASLIDGIDIFPVTSIQDAVNHLTGAHPLSALTAKVSLQEIAADAKNWVVVSPKHNPLYRDDMSDVVGQEKAKRALEIAAAGGHHLLMEGPCGAGKTMLARRLPQLLPAMTAEEIIEVTTIYSVAGMLRYAYGVVSARPFRAPHHTCSDLSIVGGGRPPRSGEVSLAHRGVLFLDELSEFRVGVLAGLYNVLQEGRSYRAHPSRPESFYDYPAKPLVVASMNQCPCGYRGSSRRECRCSSEQVTRYRARATDLYPLFDMRVEVCEIQIGTTVPTADTSAEIRSRVEAARTFRTERHTDMESALDETRFEVWPAMDLDARTKTLRVARTIADLALSTHIHEEHVAEALSFSVS